MDIKRCSCRKNCQSLRSPHLLMMFNNLPQECVEIIVDFLSFEDIQKVKKLIPEIQDKIFLSNRRK